MRLRFRLISAAFAAALVVAGTPARADFADTYTAGHADLNIGYNATTQTLELNFEFASNAVINGSVLGVAGAGERDADTITTVVGMNTLGVGPAGLPAPFSGSPLWVLPQISQALKPFVGIGAEEIDQNVFQGNTLTLSLLGFAQRPAGGEFVLWQFGNEANPFFNSANGISGADSLIVGAGAHDHYNWGFTQEGIYDLSFRATGVLTNGTTISTDAIYRFAVGTAAIPEPGSMTLALTGFGLCSLRLLLKRRKSAA